MSTRGKPCATTECPIARKRRWSHERARHKPLPDFVEKQLDGDYLVAIDRIERDGTRRFYRTILGRYLHADEVDLKPEPEMRGELLRGGVRLPLAFVYGEVNATASTCTPH